MSTILLLLALPIGWMIYRFDKKNRAAAQQLFKGYVDEVTQESISAQEKLDKIDAMYYANGFERVKKEHQSIVVQKKEANIGIAVMLFGVLNYIGLILFFIYYFFIQQPTQIEHIIDNENG